MASRLSLADQQTSQRYQESKPAQLAKQHWTRLGANTAQLANPGLQGLRTGHSTVQQPGCVSGDTAPEWTGPRCRPASRAWLEAMVAACRETTAQTQCLGVRLSPLLLLRVGAGQGLSVQLLHPLLASCGLL